jgi:hypothetical protein
MACFRPVWASEITSCTPASHGPSRSAGTPSERAVLAVADLAAEHVAATVGADPVAITTARDTTRLSTRALT